MLLEGLFGEALQSEHTFILVVADIVAPPGPP